MLVRCRGRSSRRSLGLQGPYAHQGYYAARNTHQSQHYARGIPGLENQVRVGLWWFVQSLDWQLCWILLSFNFILLSNFKLHHYFFQKCCIWFPLTHLSGPSTPTRLGLPLPGLTMSPLCTLSHCFSTHPAPFVLCLFALVSLAVPSLTHLSPAAMAWLLLILPLVGLLLLLDTYIFYI